jgi:cytochrome c-type biogenesis protein CcmH/NrfF
MGSAVRRRRFGFGLLLGVCAFTSAVATAQATAQGTTAQSAQPGSSTAAPTAALIVPPLPGVDRAFDERVKRIASRLRCPVCQGESIQDSPAELSSQMKTLVREQLANGKTEAEVLDYFLAKYGQWILLEPRAEGFNLLVYWLPVFFLVFGAGGLWFVVRKWTRPSLHAPQSDSSDTVVE